MPVSRNGPKKRILSILSVVTDDRPGFRGIGGETGFDFIPVPPEDEHNKDRGSCLTRQFDGLYALCGF